MPLLLTLNRFHTLFWCSIVAGVANAGLFYFITFQKQKQLFLFQKHLFIGVFYETNGSCFAEQLLVTASEKCGKIFLNFSFYSMECLKQRRSLQFRYYLGWIVL